MTREEHLLTILAEECTELAHRCHKALRFGLTETQPGQPYDNSQRIVCEYTDVLGAAAHLGLVANPGGIEAKREKIERYLEHSRRCGTLDE